MARAGTDVKHQTAVNLLAHPVRVQVLTIANRRAISPARLVEEVLGIRTGAPEEAHRKAVAHVSYHFRALHEAGCLEVLDLIPKRGSVEHIYRGVARAHFTDEEWAKVPDEEKAEITTVTWQGLVAVAEAARLEGTLDSRNDRWLAYTLAQLDEQGWSEMTAAMAANYAELERIRENAEARLEGTGEEGIPTAFSQMGFESAPDLPSWKARPAYVWARPRDDDGTGG